jgi:uncharacterized OB-fold protein
VASDGFVVGGISIPFSYAAGRSGSRFLTELRDDCRISGTRCPRCRRVLVPARGFCPRCQVATDEWVEVGPAGELRRFVVVRQARPYHPLPTPFAYGLIRLDGADTEFLHLVAGVPMEALRVGLRVRPLFREERTASILDIAYFGPEESAPEEASTEGSSPQGFAPEWTSPEGSSPQELAPEETHHADRV